MVVVSRNTGSAPLIGSTVIRDRVSDRSIWGEKESSDPRSDAKLRPAWGRLDARWRGRPDARWSGKAPLVGLPSTESSATLLQEGSLLVIHQSSKSIALGNTSKQHARSYLLQISSLLWSCLLQISVSIYPNYTFYVLVHNKAIIGNPDILKGLKRTIRTVQQCTDLLQR